MKGIKLSVIIPAYNEEETIERAISETEKTLKREKIKSEIIVVNDGSKDRTRSVCESISSKYEFRLINMDKNRGYAAAIKMGIKEATGDYICYLDSDLQYRPSDMARMYKYAAESGYPAVIGEHSTKNYNFFKKVRSKTYNYFFIRPLFRLKTRDVNSLKVLKSDAIRGMKLEGGVWIIDLEILHKLRLKGHEIHTFPINVYSRELGKSKTNTWSIIKTFIEMVLLRISTLHAKN